MDRDTYDDLPTHLEPEERIACTLEQVDLMRRVLAWMMYRYKLPTVIELGKFELDHAPIESLIVGKDKSGNARVTIDLLNMGS